MQVAANGIVGFKLIGDCAVTYAGDQADWRFTICVSNADTPQLLGAHKPLHVVAETVGSLLPMYADRPKGPLHADRAGGKSASSRCPTSPS